VSETDASCAWSVLWDVAVCGTWGEEAGGGQPTGAPTEPVALFLEGAQVTLGLVEGVVRVLCRALLVLIRLVELDLPALELGARGVRVARALVEFECLSEERAEESDGRVRRQRVRRKPGQQRRERHGVHVRRQFYDQHAAAVAVRHRVRGGSMGVRPFDKRRGR
jgi:hypothetical protein